jgi:hypothetical protein
VDTLLAHLWSNFILVLLRKIPRIPGLYVDTVLTVIWRHILNNLRKSRKSLGALVGALFHWRLKKGDINNTSWGKSRESDSLQGGYNHWCSEEAEIGNSNWGRSRGIWAKENFPLSELWSPVPIRWYYGWCLFLTELKCRLKARGSLCSLAPDGIMTGTTEVQVKPVVRAMNPLHAVTPTLFAIHFNIISHLGLHFPVVSSLWGCVQIPPLYSDPNRVTWRAWLHARFCSFQRFLICPAHHPFCTAELCCQHSFQLSCILLIRETSSL